MPSLKDLRKRIASVKSTQQITKAMKMVAASKLRKATEAALSARDYSGGIEDLFQSLMASMDDAVEHPLVAGRDDVRSAAIVVLSSDRGLCGSFNSGLFRTVERFVWEERDRFKNLEEIALWTYGRKAGDYFKHHGFEVARTEIGLDPEGFFPAAQSLGRDLTSRYENKRIDRAYVAFNTFQSALVQNPTISQIFPLTQGDDEAAGPDSEPDDAGSERVFEPSRGRVFETLLPKYLDTVLYQAYLESEAGEHGARMTSMDAATRNAGDMIDRLTLQYNRARQAAITKELVEIVSGAEAL